MLLLRIVIVLSSVFFAAGTSWFDRLNWRDLVPRDAPMANPFTQLPPLARSAVRDMIWIRKSIENGRSATELEEMELEARRPIRSFMCAAGKDFNFRNCTCLSGLPDE